MELLFVFCRRQGEPPLENGFLPYLGCALKFGANPLEFLKEKQKKHGHIFTCHVAGKYIHFLTDPFSYHALMRQGKHLDWKKFHFATSAKVFLVFISNMQSICLHTQLIPVNITMPLDSYGLVSHFCTFTGLKY